jgi:tRNA-dihydrouridine synthase B
MNVCPSFTVGHIPIYGDLVLAPMAGYSDLPYRSICREMGSAMSYTEFVSARGLLSANERTYQILAFDPRERPVVFQVFGHDPDRLLAACQRMQDLGPDIIDINMGCPAARVSNQGGGAGLLRTPKTIARILERLTAHLSVPITAKIRLGWDESARNHLEIARILQEGGAALIAVHGRTRSQGYVAPADWDAIAAVKQAVAIPVLGNGDVHCATDIARIKAHTGCDGVMIGRAAVGNPWILGRRDLADVSLEERLAMIRRHLDRQTTFYGEPRGIILFRKHIVRYLHGLPGAAQVRAQLMTCTTRDQVLACLDGACFLHPDENML